MSTQVSTRDGKLPSIGQKLTAKLPCALASSSRLHGARPVGTAAEPHLLLYMQGLEVVRVEWKADPAGGRPQMAEIPDSAEVPALYSTCTARHDVPLSAVFGVFWARPAYPALAQAWVQALSYQKLQTHC